MTIPDAAVEVCVRDHDRRVESCEYCDVRATWQRCNGCDARWEDGDQVDAGAVGHEHVVCDDWWNEITCGVMATLIQRIPGFENVSQRCGDQVVPGHERCPFHQGWADQDECGAVYQRLITVTR